MGVRALAGVLVQGIDASERTLPCGDTKEAKTVHADDATSFLSSRTAELAQLIEAATRSLQEDVQERAFGEPGQPGDPEEIRKRAGELIASHADLLDWSRQVRSDVPPARYRSLFEATALMAQAPAEQIREFVNELVRELSSLPEDLAADSRPHVIRATLTLQLDPRVSARLEAELAVLRQLL